MLEEKGFIVLTIRWLLSWSKRIRLSKNNFWCAYCKSSRQLFTFVKKLFALFLFLGILLHFLNRKTEADSYYRRLFPNFEDPYV
jgi:hypothetical protein